MKNPGTLLSLIAIFLLASVARGFSVNVTTVNIHGLTNAGGTFALGIDDQPLDPVTISQPSVTNSRGGGQTALSDDTTIELNLLSAVPALSATVSGSFTFTAPTQMQLTFGSDSSVTSSTWESLTFSLLNVGGDTHWNVDPIANCSVVFTGTDGGTSCIITPTSATLNSQFVITVLADTPTNGLGMTLTTAPGTNLATADYSVAMQPVPEPATIALLTAGGFAVLVLRRQKTAPRADG